MPLGALPVFYVNVDTISIVFSTFIFLIFVRQYYNRTSYVNMLPEIKKKPKIKEASI
jgi:hypothetical protein